MVDDQASDPTQKEGQQKANEIVVVHGKNSFRLCDVIKLLLAVIGGAHITQKVCTTEVIHTEKRKPRLLSHKLN